MKLHILGCGTSSGVPRADGYWGDCDPADPRNRRSRASILVESRSTRLLVDTSPDLRAQLIEAGSPAPDAVIWTHEHADHCHGIDDLRPFYFHRNVPIPGYARPRTLAELALRFAFAFEGHQGYPAYIDGRALAADQMVGDIRVRVVDLPHGPISSAGIRFDTHDGSAVYSTDFNILTDEAAELFKQVDIWVVDAVRRRPHPTHPHLAQALAWIDALQPRRAVLTHMDQSMDYATLCAELPEGVEPGWDGLELETR